VSGTGAHVSLPLQRTHTCRLVVREYVVILACILTDVLSFNEPIALLIRPRSYVIPHADDGHAMTEKACLYCAKS
jgi:hypothetical protein